MKGNYFCMSLIQMSRSAVRRAGRVGALRQEVESIKRGHRSGFLGRWTNHSLAPAALEEDFTPACVYLLFWPYPTLGMGGERVEGSNGGRGWLWLGRGTEGRERESMH